MACALVLLAFVGLAAATNNDAHLGRGHVGFERESALLQTYNKELSNAKDTPVTRVVNLLKEMSKTIQKEQEEDEELYHQLSCWCNDNVYEKKQSAEANSAKIEELTHTIERLTAKSEELKTKIAQLEGEVKADKENLAKATAVREKQLKEFHDMEMDDIEAIENLKAAIVVLSRHTDMPTPFPDGDSSGNPYGAEAAKKPIVSLLAVKGVDSPFGPEHMTEKTFAFDEFLRKGSFELGAEGVHSEHAAVSSHSHFLQSSGSSASAANAVVNGMSPADELTMRTAMKTVSTFLQAKHEQGYYPSYAAKSGEILGIMKQLKAEMEKDLLEAQKLEANRAATFNELRSAKTSEIEAGEKMAEQKEDEKATCDNDLAEAKEDLGVTEAALAEDQKFSADVVKTCAEAEKNFNERKNARMQEIKAVSETIEILTGDEARDAMTVTFQDGPVASQSLIQTGSSKNNKLRKQAAAILRKTRSPQLSMLATSVELDAFTKVKEMIDKMIVMLKKQQEDEVKKNDYCVSSLQENEMQTMKTKDLKSDLEAKIDQLEATIKRLSEEIEQAKLDISNLQVALQRASEDRKAENLDFQKTVAEQMVTAEVLHTALDKLATYYDSAAFTQMKAGKKQTPPVPQMEYKKSEGASGVMQMIEKLIYETKEITAESKKSESEAQAAYEQLIANTNDSIANLMKEIADKTKDRAQAKKDLSETQGDHSDAVAELEELGKTNADLHAECDYYTKNFNIRQQARAEEIEALQQAKQILSGAILGDTAK